MDPNANGPTNPGATPPPPSWGTPPPPPAPPAWGATPPPASPPAWGATPPAAPPAWGVAAPASSGVGAAVGNAGRNILLRIVGLVVVVGLLGGGYFVYQKVVNPDHLGQVLFTTVDPAGMSNCTIDHQVTTVPVGTSVYAVYMWTKQLDITQKVQEEGFKDGVSMGDKFDVPRTKTSDCLLDSTDLKDVFTDPATYELKLTVGTEVVADGKLIVTK